MTIIKPFAAFRPVPDKVGAVACPPYDVISSAEAREMAADNPDSFLHVVKPEIDLSEETPPYADEVYATGKRNLERFIREGLLQQEDQPCLYLYRQSMPIHDRIHTQIGLVAATSVAEYENGQIRKHEFTRVAKEADRTRHVETLNANTGPVFLTFRSRTDISRMFTELSRRPPEYDFMAQDGISHTLWIIQESAEIKTLCNAFEDVPALYIADGHHRSASATNVCQRRRSANPDHTGNEPYNTFLSVIFPHDQLMCLDYNRVVTDLNNLSAEQFLSRIGERFDVSPTETPKPSQPQTFGMYLQQRWYRLNAKGGTFDSTDPVNGLDVAILQNNLLSPILNIGDPRTDDRIDFVGGIRGMAELERLVDTGAAVAFAMFPTSIEQLMAIADAGQVMPPKSTWFEPKLRSGLIVKPLW